jgi:hypothetical protein
MRKPEVIERHMEAEEPVLFSALDPRDAPALPLGLIQGHEPGFVALVAGKEERRPERPVIKPAGAPVPLDREQVIVIPRERGAINARRSIVRDPSAQHLAADELDRGVRDRLPMRRPNVDLNARGLNRHGFAASRSIAQGSSPTSRSASAIRLIDARAGDRLLSGA